MRLSDIQLAVILSLYLCIYVRLDISATVTPIGIKSCTMVYMGPYFVGSDLNRAATTGPYQPVTLLLEGT